MMEVFTQKFRIIGSSVWDQNGSIVSLFCGMCHRQVEEKEETWGWSPQLEKWVCPDCSATAFQYPYEVLKMCSRSTSYIPFFGHVEVPELVPLIGGVRGQEIGVTGAFASKLRMYSFLIHGSVIDDIAWIEAVWGDSPCNGRFSGVILMPQHEVTVRTEKGNRIKFVPKDEVCHASSPHGAFARVY